ncbi:MAG: hypothetical protein IJU25_01970, partial [Lachnospiraceae bacterium]|nr:hypothetical protein [Lachnospiraceae bacterium]
EAKFDQLDKKFEAKFDQLDKKFEAKFDQLDKKFEAKFNQLDQKIESKTDLLMNYIFEVNKTAQDTKKNVISMDKRLQNVESIVKQRWNIPKLADQVDAIGYEVGKHTERLNEHDRQLAAIAN